MQPTLVPNPPERLIRCCCGQRLTRAVHPNATLLPQRHRAANGAQGDALSLGVDLESITSPKVEFLPQRLGKNDPARFIEGALHRDGTILL